MVHIHCGDILDCRKSDLLESKLDLPHKKQPGGIRLLGDPALAATMPLAQLAVTPKHGLGGVLSGDQSLCLGQRFLKVSFEVGDREFFELFLDIHNAPDGERRALNPL